MTVFSDREQVQQEIAAGGWDILWGDVINEFDALTFLVSLPTGTTAAWVAEQVEVQLQKFAQSSTDVSSDVLHQATLILEGIVEGKWLGKWDINGLEVKGGIATYHRWWKFGFWKLRLGGKKRLPNNYQPYIGLRVAQALPPKGTLADPRPVQQTRIPSDETKY
ncbi:uncharacterized protein PV09_06919 [Verruconis gallopava]|uniref:Uncharacterized protein n=1 Tax=Verruconis gallopava TaxID=253628 RepID=A0A0D2A4N0_9PEZI|nr:uncharacterized protein PV09_06919 [Verruconis gallopava]KIW01743.1 hypothetical protein PV09_06919 [Verruconis gallopava]